MKRAKKKTDLQKAKKVLWELCKQIIRKRHGNICYTCGKTELTGSNWQTGHFIPSSVCSIEMRYSLDNLRPQCMPCNCHKSGNWIEYEKHLREDMGEDFPEQLKKRNDATKGGMYRLDWYQDKIEEYKETLNEDDKQETSQYRSTSK